MMKIDPIIAVKDVGDSVQWYQQIFGFTRTHGGSDFAVLEWDNEIVLCLHKWGEHDHPTMKDRNITTDNGLILYFKTDRMDEIRQNIKRSGYPVEEEVHLNPNSTKKEFSLRDPDGYYLLVTEFHKYEG